MIREQKVVSCEHWIDNNNGTISCSHCHTWFHKDDRYSYMRYCPYCSMKLAENNTKQALNYADQDILMPAT